MYTDVNQRVARVHLRRLRLADHYVDKGGPGGPGRPPNGQAKKKGRGYFYQMSNMYTCIAYLIEIGKFCSKNLVHKGVNFEVQNAVKTHTRASLISKNFRGLYPRTPVKRGREKDERDGQGRLPHCCRLSQHDRCRVMHPVACWHNCRSLRRQSIIYLTCPPIIENRILSPWHCAQSTELLCTSSPHSEMGDRSRVYRF